MTDIAFHITDIAENSLRAGAGNIAVGLTLEGTRLLLSVTDDGCGMDRETAARAVHPFCTSRTARRVGLGLPFLFQNAALSGGSAALRSAPGRGTTVTARFMTDHPDCLPAGDLAETLMQLVTGNPAANIVLRLACDGRSSVLRSADLTDALGGLPLGLPETATAIRSLIAHRLDSVFGDRLNY